MPRCIIKRIIDSSIDGVLTAKEEEAEIEWIGEGKTSGSSKCEKENKLYEAFYKPHTVSQKGWWLVAKFYNLILDTMNERGIKPSVLSKAMGIRESDLTKKLISAPDISILKMVEYADAVGLDIDIVAKKQETPNECPDMWR